MGIEHKQDANFHYLYVNGGENWHNLVQWSLTLKAFMVLENLALIPGCRIGNLSKISVLMA